MTTTRAVVCLVAIALIGLTVAPVAAAVGGLPAPEDTTVDATTDNDADSTNDSEDNPVSDELSTFMQASSASAAQDVDDGMFDAKYERADEERRAELLAERTSSYEAQLASVEDELGTLEDEGEDVHPAEYEAQMTRLAVQLSGLDRSMNHTEQRASAAGIDVSELHELRTNASELAGPEVAERAQGIQGVEPPRGAPDHAGGPAGDDNDTSGGQPPDAGSGDGGPPGDAEGSDGGDKADDVGEDDDTLVEEEDEDDEALGEDEDEDDAELDDSDSTADDDDSTDHGDS